MSGHKLFGYWIHVRDEASAREAVRMSGLPVLLMGANSALLMLIALVQRQSNTAVVVVLAAIAVILILLAFRIRSGHAAWVPFVLLLFAVFVGASAFLSYVGWQLAGQTRTGIPQMVLSWVIPAICLILVICGVRGWRWMKVHKVRVAF